MQSSGDSRDELIDDMEDRTPGIVSSTAYASWFVYNDGSIGGMQKPAPETPFTMEPIPGGRCASEYAMRMTGTGFTNWGAGMGFNFGYEIQIVNGIHPPIPFDGTAFAGVRFWARVGQAVSGKVRFSLGDKNTDPAGGICARSIPVGDAGVDDDGAVPTVISTAACYNYFGKDLILTTDWVEYRVAFSDMRQLAGFVYLTDQLARDALYGVQFAVDANVTFDVWIDDIAWYRKDEL